MLADEPTTALDAIAQIQVLILLRALQKEFGMSSSSRTTSGSRRRSPKVAVMYAGRIVEYGNVRNVLTRPSHPHTRGMLTSTVHGQMRDMDIEAIPGSPPDLRWLPRGCSFSPRCKYASTECTLAFPEGVAIAPGRLTCCIKARPTSRSGWARKATIRC